MSAKKVKKTPKEKIDANLKLFRKDIQGIYNSMEKLVYQHDGGGKLIEELDNLMNQEQELKEANKAYDELDRAYSKYTSKHNYTDADYNTLVKKVASMNAANQKLAAQLTSLKETLGTFQFVKAAITVIPTVKKNKK